MFNVVNWGEVFKPEEVLDYLRKSQSDDPHRRHKANLCGTLKGAGGYCCQLSTMIITDRK